MSKLKIFILVLLLGAGCSLRLWAAWLGRESTSSDWAVVATMARDMAEGKPFPVFFYGQSYMGSLEPWVSSLFIRLLGSSGFAVNLGTTVFGMALLGLIFVWGRRTGGYWAGIAALAWSIVGSVHYLYFTVMPRGGYGTSLALGTFLLYAGAHIASVEYKTRARAHGAWYAAMGLAAGLGWWSHQSIPVFIIPAALLMMGAMRFRIFTPRILLACICFIAGALPWLLWNMGNNGASLSMTGAVVHVDWRSGLVNFGRTFASLLDAEGAPFAFAVVSGLLIVSIAAALARLTRALRRGFEDRDFFLAAAILVIAVFLLLAVRSHFLHMEQPRYLLVLWPAMAVLIGRLCTLPRTVPGRVLGTACLLATLPAHHPTIPYFLKEYRTCAARQEEAHRIARAVRDHDIDVLYGDYWSQWMNFSTTGGTRVAVLTKERYAPWAQEALLADRIAFLDGYANVEHFLRATDSTATSALNGRLRYNLKPSPIPFEPVASSNILSAVSSGGLPAAHLLTDLDLGTGLMMTNRPGEIAPFIEVEFRTPETLVGIEHWMGREGPPRNVKIKAVTGERARWTSVLDTVILPRMFWSGPRVFYASLHEHSVVRWKPATSRRWRVIFPPGTRESRFEIAELVFLRKSDNPSAGHPLDWQGLGEHLQRNGITHVYASRWLTHKLALGDFGLTGDLDPAFSRTVNSKPPRPAPSRPMSFTSSSALVMRSGYADICRQVLGMHEIFPAETAFGPWVVFHFGNDSWRPEYARAIPLRWLGPYCLQSGTERD